MNSSTPISELIRMRTSRRTYQAEPLSGDILKSIEQKTGEISRGLLGTAMEFSLVNLHDFSNRKLKLGTYGFIQGARHFIAGQVKPSREAFLDYGCVMENLILEFTRMGLGTCWLGGTFDRGEFAKAISLKKGCVIPAITPVGFATSSRGLGDRIIRLGAGSNNRLPRERLFFDKVTGLPVDFPDSHPYSHILDAVRLAPSASNNQPWRIVADGSEFRFYIARKPGYQKAFSGIDLQMIDIGIAMAHFDQVAREYDKDPEWTILPGTPPHEGCEYVISVLLPE